MDIVDFKQLLNEARISERLVGIHTDPQDISSFALGWLEDVQESIYALWSIDGYGRQDSLQIGYIEDIVRLSLDGPYISRMEAFAKAQLPLSLQAGSTVEANFMAFLKSLIGSEEIVTLLDRNRVPVSGRIEGLSEEIVLFLEISKEGLALGRLAIPIATVFRIEAFGIQERSIGQLYSWLQEYSANSERS